MTIGCCWFPFFTRKPHYETDPDILNAWFDEVFDGSPIVEVYDSAQIAAYPVMLAGAEARGYIRERTAGSPETRTARTIFRRFCD